MGLFDFLFKKMGDSQLSKINITLKDSFSNVKKDVGLLHSHISTHKDHTNKRFEDVEERIKKIELVLQAFIQKPEIIKQPTSIKEISLETEEQAGTQEDITNVLSGLPRAELKLFKALYELQLSLNAKHISYKSLANYLYPGKEYNSIRSTITQFVLRLHTEGLIEKQRIGKETYVKITQTGQKILKNVKSKKALKEEIKV